MFQNGTNHFLHELAGGEAVSQALGDGGPLNAEKIGQSLLGHPEVFVHENDLDALFAVGGAIKNDLVGRGRDQ